VLTLTASATSPVRYVWQFYRDGSPPTPGKEPGSGFYCCEGLVRSGTRLLRGLSLLARCSPSA
jgi:hypothetical protein